MTTTSTAPATRDFRAEYVTARVAVRRSRGIAEVYANEAAAQAILDDADAAGVDLYADALELDELARVELFRCYTDAELRDLLADPYARGLARTVLTERGEL